MAKALPLHWVSTPMKYEQRGRRLAIAGFCFFMAKGMLWLIGLSFVYVLGL